MVRHTIRSCLGQAVWPLAVSLCSYVLINNIYATKLVGSRSYLEEHNWGHLKERLGTTGPDK